MAIAILSLLAGLALLTYSGDQFVLGSSHLARTLRLSPVVVGAVVLGFGTSAPELVVSSLAALRGDPALGIGNIVGSNVANLSLGLGLAAVLTPVMCSRSLLHKEAAMSVGSTAIFALLVIDGNLALWEGIVLMVLLVLAIGTLIKTTSLTSEMVPKSNELLGESTAPERKVPERQAPERKVPERQAPEHQAPERQAIAADLLRTVLGLLGVLISAQLAVYGSTEIADEIGLSKGFVGFSIVAVGTSLPELATVMAAARKGHTELILGNLLGSNLFNSLAVSGAMGLVGAGEIMDDSIVQIGIPVMVGVSLVAYLMAYTKGKVGRAEGVALLLIYAAAMVALGVLA